MKTYEDVLDLSAASLNDSAKTTYTNAAILPYLNMALMELEEIFELNNIPTTEETSGIITVPDGSTVVGYDTIPPLPSNLVDIKQLFESETGQNIFIPMTPVNSLTQNSLGDVLVSQFRVYKWKGQQIEVLAASVDIDLKIEYIKSLFEFLTSNELDDVLAVVNSGSFLQFRAAGLIAELIEVDIVRADRLNNNAATALERSLGIGVKSTQAIFTRRRPFRSGFKRRRRVY